MKKILCLLLAAAMLCGLAACSNAPATHSPAEEPVKSSYSIYLPNENVDGFDIETVNTDEISAETVLSELKKHEVLPDGVAINSF